MRILPALPSRHPAPRPRAAWPRSLRIVLCMILLCALMRPVSAIPAHAEAKPPDNPIVFNDYRLEKKVREALGKMEGDITISDAKSLRELDISNHRGDIPEEDRVRDISALSHFTNLVVFRAIENAIGDISPLSNMPGLSYLDLGGNSVSDLSPLSVLKDLKEVALWGNGEISDLSPLFASKELVSLNAPGNRIEDLSPLADHAKLEFLDLSDNRIRDVSPLAGLDNLIVLRLAGNPVDNWSALSAIYPSIAETDFDPGQRGASDLIAFDDPVLERKVRALLGKPEGDIRFSDVRSIEELDLGRDESEPEEAKVRSLEALRDFPSLRKLEAWNNDIRDLSPLAGLEELFILQLDGNPIESLAPLSGLSNLVLLTVAYCGIEDVGPLSGLERLEHLILINNRITDASPLSGLSNLRVLRLSGNPIADLSPLRDIQASLEDKDFEVLIADNVPDEPIEIAQPAFEAALRRAMDIHGRPITQKDAFLTRSLGLFNEKTVESEFSDISPLKWFVNLEELSFNANPISDLTPLRELAKLKTLTVAFSQVSDLAPLSALTSLEFLNLRNCQITDVSPLAGLTSLKQLILTDNPIEDMSPLDGLLPGLSIER